MTLYFTPVGTIAEQTRAKGSQINDREAAVTAGFAAIEAALTDDTDGASSITYGSGWSAQRVVLTKNAALKMAFLHVFVLAISTPEPSIMQLPAGYFPSAIDGFYASGSYYSQGSGLIHCAHVIINELGGITSYARNVAGNGELTKQTGDSLVFSVAYQIA